MTDTDFIIDRLWPEPASGLDLDRAWLDLDLPPMPPDRPWVGLNMVSTIDGRAEWPKDADGLSTRADRRLMRLLRTNYDAVVYGAGTLRASDLWTTVTPDLAAERERAGRTPQPLAVVVGGSGPIPTDRRWFRTDQPRLVLVGSGGPAEVADAEVVRAPTPRPEPAWVLAELQRRGIERVLLEGGPQLNAAFHAAGLMDEMYLTIGALVLGGDGERIIASGPAELRPVTLISVHRFGDELYLRYRFDSAGGA